MPDYTQEEARGYLRTAMLKVSGLSEDRLLWGNREATWTKTDRAYRFEHEETEDLGWYRNRPGGRMRVSESITIHLSHRVPYDNEKAESRAGRDAEKVRRRLLNDSGILGSGIRVHVDPASIVLSDSGDTLETDIAIRLEYDFALTSEAA